MPKNKGKGGKNRRRGKNDTETVKRELVFKGEIDQEYAQVLRMFGNGRLEAQCFDGQKRVCHIRGKMCKKVWINVGDIILVGLRSYQDEKCDVIMKYSADEARQLKAYGELPESAKIGADMAAGSTTNDDTQIDFVTDDVASDNSDGVPYDAGRLGKSDSSDESDNNKDLPSKTVKWNDKPPQNTKPHTTKPKPSAVKPLYTDKSTARSNKNIVSEDFDDL
jgi:translation initiation factor 1A